MTTIEEKNKRKLSVSANDSLDYLDNDIRRIFPSGSELKLEDKIFDEHIALCLTDTPVKIKIKNCEFKKGVNVRRGDIDKDYTVFIYKSEVKGCLSLLTHDNYNDISIDSCIIGELFLAGKSHKIDLYNAEIETLTIEHLKSDIFSISETKITKFKLFDFTHNEVRFDTDNLAISDYSKFLTNSGQTVKEVSEIYHRFVLKAAKSIKSASAVNYELTKSTSSNFACIFGYFYKPIQVIFWMLFFILLFALVFTFKYDLNFIDGFFQSALTFLTIGFYKTQNPSVIDSLLMLTEGVVGIVYTATLLTSIINSTRKQ
jgi:hypothetical protein